MKSLWKIVEDVCRIEISFGKVLGTEDFNGYDHVLTLISFLIYKEWLLLSLEGKTRQRNINLEFYKNSIYLLISWTQCCIYGHKEQHVSSKPHDKHHIYRPSHHMTAPTEMDIVRFYGWH